MVYPDKSCIDCYANASADRRRLRSSAANTNRVDARLHCRVAPPNPSLKRSANGKALGPGCGEVHSPQPGHGALPLGLA